MINGDVILNTENHGVMFFNKDKLTEDHRNSLSLADLETMLDQRDRGYSVIFLGVNKKANNLTIFSESETENKLSFSKRNSAKNYEQVEEEFVIDRPHPIMKLVFHDFGNWTEVLDTAGNATIVGLHNNKVHKINALCTEIFENWRMYSRFLVRDNAEQGGKLKLRTNLHGELQEEKDDFNLNKSIAELNHVASFFTHCLSAAQGLLLLVYENEVYLRRERASSDKYWLQCITFDSTIVALHTIGTDEISRLNTKFVCITETAVVILSLPIDK